MCVYSLYIYIYIYIGYARLYRGCSIGIMEKMETTVGLGFRAYMMVRYNFEHHYIGLAEKREQDSIGSNAVGPGDREQLVLMAMLHGDTCNDPFMRYSEHNFSHNNCRLQVAKSSTKST